ncbi:type IV pilin N-terminal domain-containing protein [Methanolacinia paynteri]|uniref:type IV pilin N-terminal domain-containing protein n=1 Tax=Methanolacinia paynteri TaxID=230356 RepID=UPI000694BE69|nr:type IV pilin N-terminal domain-containing protein [Methanolacinia paynteri]
MTGVKSDAVSPVIGIMLMLVVTIIIAAVVSAFGSGMVDSQSKAPQAKVSATFSVSEGMTFTHDGGDAIPLDNLVFITQHGPGFGPNLEEFSEVLNRSIITDKDGNQVFLTINTGGKSSFNPGDTLYISTENCSMEMLQPGLYATYRSGGGAAVNALKYQSSKNVGKVFLLKTSDKSGNLISTSEVKITS